MRFLWAAHIKKSSLCADHERRQLSDIAMLADPARLALLTCIGAAEPISVFDLVAPAGRTTPLSRRRSATCASFRSSVRGATAGLSDTCLPTSSSPGWAGSGPGSGHQCGTGAGGVGTRRPRAWRISSQPRGRTVPACAVPHRTGRPRRSAPAARRYPSARRCPRQCRDERWPPDGPARPPTSEIVATVAGPSAAQPSRTPNWSTSARPATRTRRPSSRDGCRTAVRRYRLYDIDRLISCTLAYAAVTGLLIGLYVGWCCWPPASCRCPPGWPSPDRRGGGSAVRPAAATGAARRGPAVQPRPLRRRPDRRGVRRPPAGLRGPVRRARRSGGNHRARHSTRAPIAGRERPDPTADQGASQTGRARYPFETKDSRGISSPGSTARVRSG
jgi:hypothetical protein